MYMRICTPIDRYIRSVFQFRGALKLSEVTDFFSSVLSNITATHQAKFYSGQIEWWFLGSCFKIGLKGTAPCRASWHKDRKKEFFFSKQDWRFVMDPFFALISYRQFNCRKLCQIVGLLSISREYKFNERRPIRFSWVQFRYYWTIMNLGA